MSLTIGEPIINAITVALKQKQAIELRSAADGSMIVNPLGFLPAIWHWNDAGFHEERLSKLASVVSKVISLQPRMSIPEAAKDPILKAGRNLLKEAKDYEVRSSDINDLQKEVTAAKLGLNAATLDSNPGLQKLAEQTHLERYLLIFKHAIQTDTATQQISILKDGALQVWSSIFEESKTWEESKRLPKCSWPYGQQGIQNLDMYDWSELKPFMKGDPVEWNHQYVFEFCSCHNPDSIKNGVHSWIRLKTPTGDIYSVGLYRPDKIDANYNMPLRVKPAYLMQPDVSEFWDFEITKVDFAISEEAFYKIKQTIENDKRNEEELIFQVFDSNCLLYNKKLGKIGGVDLPTLDNVLCFITPTNIAQSVAKFMDKLPSFVQKVCLYVTAFFVNCAQALLGGCKIGDELNEKQKKKAIPHINSFADLFDVNKIYLHHPNTVGYKTREQVLCWRMREIELLNQTVTDLRVRDEKIKVIQLSLPPDYYIASSFM